MRFWRNSFWGKGLSSFCGFGDWVCFAQKGYGFLPFLRQMWEPRARFGRILGSGFSIDYWGAWGGERIADWVGLGLFWVCFFGLGGVVVVCKSL